MEIVMKVKCSPSPGAGSSPHSTLKIVDHHHQLQQHTFASAGYKTSASPNNVISPGTYTPNNHLGGGKYPITSNSTTSSCNDCSMGYCCNISSCCAATPSPHYSHTPPQSTLSSIAAPPQYPHPESYTNNFPIQPMDEPEFVSIDDEKVKQYLIRLGQQQIEKQQYQHHSYRPQKEPKITHVVSASTTESTAKPVIYEIIELDDEDEREKLKQIKQQAERSLANKKLPANLSINFGNRHTKSLDISLIPKTPDKSYTQKTSHELALISQQASSRELNKKSLKHNIIAEIDLVDSDEDDPYMNDDDDGDDEDEEDALPLVAVSCELQCDDEDEDVRNNSSASYSRSSNPSYNTNYLNIQQHRDTMKYSKPLVDDVMIVGSHGNKNSDDMLVRWEEYEGHKERVFFECFLCGKKVQSSYNLRRHMMIHTGERPFGCDLCDRRFREFSDMKKHRRRHSNEPRYLCMICHERAPLENDPTRCINCCTQSKNAVIMAAMKPATDADNAVQKNSRIKATNISESSQPSTAQKQQQMLPTISSVTSYNIAAIKSETPPTPSTSPPENSNGGNANGNANNANGNGNNANAKGSEQTQRLLDNIPAVHRPGYSELGMITRKEFPCPLCNRAFGTRHNLKRHYMIHTGEKPFNCTKCRKPFREYSTLKKHMVTHMRERWYKCMRCPLRFRDFLKYTDHKESHRNDSDSEEHPPIMGRGSMGETKYDSSHVDVYMDSHDEDSGADDWLECCECGQRFNEINAYTEHLKEHDANNQIFQCYICKNQLKSRSELDLHIKQQHKLEIADSMDEDYEDNEDAATT